MPFSLQSDEALIAEARRGLEALGLEVVLDHASTDLQDCMWVNGLHDTRRRVVISTNRTAIAKSDPEHPEKKAALILAVFISDMGETVGAMHSVRRNRDHADAAAAAASWWQRNSADPKWRFKPITCDLCRRQEPPKPSVCSCCYQCQAFLCTSCAHRRGATTGNGFKCHRCGAWDYASGAWGVPWDMPRPAPTRRSAAPPQLSAALPPRMAEAVGPDGWLRLPPQHQRMHPVDVLVDGVLGVLDGEMLVCPYAAGTSGSNADEVDFTRCALAEQFFNGATLDSVRRQLKQRVDRLVKQTGGRAIQEVWVPVSVCCRREGVHGLCLSHYRLNRWRQALFGCGDVCLANARLALVHWCGAGAPQGVAGPPHG